MAASSAAAPASTETPTLRRLPFGTVALGVTVGTVLVVLLGAVVRITGSGAGCGQHWPTCHGEIAHLPKTVETWIELSHRATSGLDLLAVLGVAVLARTFPRRHPARIAAFTAFALIVVEALVGARLVLLNLVGSNMSLDRVVIMPVHLVTTSLLIGALSAASYFGSPHRLRREASLTPERSERLRRAMLWSGVTGAFLLLVSMTGAITALGDTVYPVQGQGALEHLRNDQAASSHLLGKLRVVHPLLAVLGVAGLWAVAGRAREATESPPVQWLGAALYVGGALALAVGVTNVWLAAPGYLQVIHLLVACLLWLGIVTMTAMLWDLRARADESLR